MNAYEISISVRLNPISSQTGKTRLSGDGANGDALVYGILPDQAAVDEVMRQLCNVGITVLQANTHSDTVSELADELRTAFEPRPACLN
jgi:hypothetical protein